MERQMMMADDSCGPLAQAVDAAIDQAMAAFQAGQPQQGMALLTAADVAMDGLLQAMGMVDPDEGQQGGSMQPMAPMSGMNSALAVGEVRSDESEWAIRDFAFQMEAASDGLTLEGYAAVFNQPARISGWEGDFEEQVAPGAFARTLRERTPVLMFNHGKHPLIGDMPLGVIKRAVEDSKGVYISARLSDNWLIQPVRDAVRDGAVTGMSFRFAVPKGGDAWLDRKGALRLRTLKDIDVPELGPVVFPAYQPTTATVRSALDCIDCELTGRPVARSAGGGDSTGTAPGNGDRPTSLSVERVRAHRDLLFRGIIRA